MYKRSVLIIGYGAIGKCVLLHLFEKLSFPAKLENIVIDPIDPKKRSQEILQKPALSQKITQNGIIWLMTFVGHTFGYVDEPYIKVKAKILEHIKAGKHLNGKNGVLTPLIKEAMK